MISAFDFETCLIRPGLQAPPVVCMSGATSLNPDGYLVPTEDVPDSLRAVLLTSEIWGHNVAYDMSCAIENWPDLAPLIFEAYDSGKVFDTMLLERLGEIAGHSTRKDLSLDNVCQAHGLPALSKDPAIRLTFGQYLDRPLDEYAAEHREYAREDAVATLKLRKRQLERYDRVNKADLAELTRQHLWLTLCRAWGLRVDPKSLDTLIVECKDHVEALREIVRDAGLVRENGSKDMKAIRGRVAIAYEGAPPMTKPTRNRKSAKPFVPQVSTARTTLEESGDFLLEKFAEWGEWSSVQNKDIPMLALGAEMPIHTKWGFADTTRTTSSRPNVQNFRRGSHWKDCLSCDASVGVNESVCRCGSTEFRKRQEIRECVVPRPGHCFVAADYGGVELATLAQNILWKLGLRRMVDLLNTGTDLHALFASEMLVLEYSHIVAHRGETKIENARQCGKVSNYGFPGGMAAPTLKWFAKQSYGLNLTVDECFELRRHWENTLPECAEYLCWIRKLSDGKGRFNVEIPGSTIFRAGCTFCSAANCGFQGFAARLAARAGWYIAREMYAGGFLSRARMVNFVHDEFILECPIGTQTEIADGLVTLMKMAAVEIVPDVRIDVDAVAMNRWSKNAKRIVRNGELIIWQ